MLRSPELKCFNTVYVVRYSSFYIMTVVMYYSVLRKKFTKVIRMLVLLNQEVVLFLDLPLMVITDQYTLSCGNWCCDTTENKSSDSLHQTVFIRMHAYKRPRVCILT